MADEVVEIQVPWYNVIAVQGILSADEPQPAMAQHGNVVLPRPEPVAQHNGITLTVCLQFSIIFNIRHSCLFPCIYAPIVLTFFLSVSNFFYDIRPVYNVGLIAAWHRTALSESHFKVLLWFLSLLWGHASFQNISFCYFVISLPCYNVISLRALEYFCTLHFHDWPYLRWCRYFNVFMHFHLFSLPCCKHLNIFVYSHIYYVFPLLRTTFFFSLYNYFVHFIYYIFCPAENALSFLGWQTFFKFFAILINRILALLRMYCLLLDYASI